MATDTALDTLREINDKTASLVTVAQGTQAVSGTVAVSNFPVTQPVSASSLPLPTGAATEVTLSALNTKVTAVNTGAVVVASSALPSGASTEATLSTMSAKLPTALGSGGGLKVEGANLDYNYNTSSPGNISERSVLIGGKTFDAADQYHKDAINSVGVGTDANGNQLSALGVFDYSGGGSAASIIAMTNGSGTGSFTSLSTPGKTIVARVTGTWTGSLTPQVTSGAATITAPVRQQGTGTLVTSITANGTYLFEAEDFDSPQLGNSVATGQADIYWYSTPRYQTGIYSRQAGTWTVGLPSGASTSALQTTGNSSLSSIDTKTLAAGQATMAASSPVVIASNQSAVPVSGTVTANLAAGSNNIGDVDVITLPALVAGSAIIGKVGIDQTTPGTTNKVSIGTDGTVAINTAIPSGTNNIGDVDVLSLPALPAGTNNIGDVDVLTLPALVAGTALIGKVGIDQTTPGTTNKVSIGTDGTVALNAAIPSGTNNIGDVDVLTLPALPAGTNNIGDVDVLTLPALTAGTNRIGSVRLVDSADADLTTTKAVQATRGVQVQRIQDAGRVSLSFYAVAAAAGTTGTQTAITLTKSADTGATTTGTSFVVTSGKRFRITHISVATRGHNTATAQTTTFNLRVNTAGAVTTASTPIVFSARSATPAVANDWDRYVLALPDGHEILGDGTLQFGITAAATYTTNAPTWDVNIMGFEY